MKNKGSCELHQVGKYNNEEVDLLAKMAAVGEQHLSQLFQFEELHTLATEMEESFSIEEGESWMMLVYKFLT